MKKIIKQIGSFFSRPVVVNILVNGTLFVLIAGWLNREMETKFAKARIETENFINAKKDVYFEAISIINRRMADFDYPDVYKIDPSAIKKVRNKGTLPPSEYELNTCYQKLIMLAGDTTIPAMFYKMATTNPKIGDNYIPINDAMIFLNKVRKDLGASGEIKSQFPYIISFKGDPPAE